MSASRLRLAAALALSVLLHAAVLLLMRAPSPAPGDFEMKVLLTPLASPAPPAATAAGVTPKPERQAEPGARPRREAAPRAPLAGPERPFRRQPIVTAGPISPPDQGLASRLADAASYVDAARLRSYPRLAGELAARYPPAAFGQGRKAVVVVQLMIDENGRVTEALAAPGPGEDFVAAALEALRGARFEAGRTASGKAVRARAYFAVSFVLE